MIARDQPLVRPEMWVLVAYGLLNLAILLALSPAPNADWATAWWPLEGWGREVYDHPWRYSPVLLPVMSLVVVGGPLLLGAAHLVALIPLARIGEWTSWAVAFSAFFWVDLMVGNVFTFVAVAAALAISGSRTGSILFLALTLVMPRPVQLPLALWLLWRRADLRGVFALLFAMHAAGVVASGYAADWIESLVGSSWLIDAGFSLGPGRLVGPWWLVVGIPAASWMVWRGSARVAAMAGIVLSPFLLPQYLLMGIIALPARSWAQRWLRFVGRERGGTPNTP
ncbi:MAG: hypothetical protein WEE67_07845 [Chloroflexota bacterium]